MKYSPGFDDPPTRPRLVRYRVIAVAFALLAAVLLGATFLAVSSPSFRVDIGSVLLMCAEFLGFR